MSPTVVQLGCSGCSAFLVFSGSLWYSKGLAQWQKAAGLVADGRYGDKTAAKAKALQTALQRRTLRPKGGGGITVTPIDAQHLVAQGVFPARV